MIKYIVLTPVTCFSSISLYLPYCLTLCSVDFCSSMLWFAFHCCLCIFYVFSFGIILRIPYNIWKLLPYFLISIQFSSLTKTLLLYTSIRFIILSVMVFRDCILGRAFGTAVKIPVKTFAFWLECLGVTTIQFLIPFSNWHLL